MTAPRPSEGGGVTPLRRNGPRRASVLLGEPLRDMNDLGPLRPGYCDFCGSPLPAGKALYCSPWCKTQMDNEYRNLGRTVAQLGLHWIGSEHGRHKGLALGRLDKVLRHFWRRLRDTRKHYRWGE